MTSERLGEVFKGDSADTDRQACADGERGPPSARAEFLMLTLSYYVSPLEINLQIIYCYYYSSIQPFLYGVVRNYGQSYKYLIRPVLN
jgi:hypothetical protein